MPGSAPNAFTDGAGYERLMGRWSAIAGDIFLDWLALPRGLRWLDVGCGNGAFTARLVARCAPAAVQGIDPSEGQLAYARIRPGTRDAEFRQGDAQALPYADASFDVVSMALAITFVPDPAKAVAEMARVVHPNGLVATYMWDGSRGGLPLEPFYVAFTAMDVAAPRQTSENASHAEEMRRLWTGAGLESVETREIGVQITFADFDDFWESTAVIAGPVANRVQSLSGAQVAHLKALLRANLPTDAQGRIVYRALANAVKGRRPA